MNKLFKQAPFFWYKKDVLSKIISYFLLPVSLIYLAVISLRRFCYLRGYLKTIHFPVPVIVIGNITVGGTGKTPLVIWLANFLQQQEGYKVGIVSRGYGGKRREGAFLVRSGSDVEVVGDESLLIARQTHCPMFIAKDRVKAVQALLQHKACDVVLSDDGLQHYALGRAIEIAVMNGVRGIGNGFCLPAGPLREPVSRLKFINFVINNNCTIGKSDKYSMCFTPEKLYNLYDPNLAKEIDELRNMEVHAVAGIGNPASFFQLLRSHEIIVHEHIFPDHHAYVATDLNFAESDMVIMTEKDAVKCKNFAKQNWWVLPIKVEVSEAFTKDLLHILNKK